MKIELDFLSNDQNYNSYEEHLFKLCQSTFEYLNLDFDCYISLSFVDNDSIHEINKEYRGIDRPTDVISFAYLDGLNREEIYKNSEQVILGDIYISLDKAKEQAEEYNHSIHREISFLFLHGLLHLLGYDHMEKDDEIIMFNLQEEILKKEGINR